MTIHWPQGILLLLMTLGLGIHLARHGDLKPAAKFSFYVKAIDTGIVCGLLYAGGFFG